LQGDQVAASAASGHLHQRATCVIRSSEGQNLRHAMHAAQRQQTGAAGEQPSNQCRRTLTQQHRPGFVRKQSHNSCHCAIATRTMPSLASALRRFAFSSTTTCVPTGATSGSTHVYTRRNRGASPGAPQLTTTDTLPLPVPTVTKTTAGHDWQGVRDMRSLLPATSHGASTKTRCCSIRERTKRRCHWVPSQ
jgi:hypothetical protein